MGIVAILRGFGHWKRAVAARLTSSERGQALVEFAVTSPMLIFLLFGTVEVGHATNAYLQVLSAARDAARLSVRGATDAEMQSIVTVETANLPNVIPTSCNVNAPGMCITRSTSPGPSSVKMQVCYNHPLIVGVPAVLPNPWLMCSATTMRRLS